MPTKSELKQEYSRQEQLIRWRFDELIALGLDPGQALALIEIPDVVNAASKLLHGGCPPHLVVRLLVE